MRLSRSALRSGPSIHASHEACSADPARASPVWSRAYSHPAGAEPAQSRCGEAAKALDALGLRRMVVGHTPQITAGINACCGGRVYRIDTGLSSFYGGMKQCLEVVSNERPRVISSTPEYFW